MQNSTYLSSNRMIGYEGTKPERATKGAACYDLCSAESDPVLMGHPIPYVFMTDLKIAIPDDCVGLVLSRSGLAAKHGIFVLNAPGIIDSDYRGKIGVILGCLYPTEFTINPGDRIAQLMIIKTVDLPWIPMNLSPTERGDGGFGSTGM